LVVWPVWFAMDFKGAADKEVTALQARQQYLAIVATERCAPTSVPPRRSASAPARTTTGMAPASARATTGMASAPAPQRLPPEAYYQPPPPPPPLPDQHATD
jgi:hypothetical protein